LKIRPQHGKFTKNLPPLVQFTKSAAGSCVIMIFLDKIVDETENKRKHQKELIEAVIKRNKFFAFDAQLTKYFVDFSE
jgi:glutamine amidotransferase PdxT